MEFEKVLQEEEGVVSRSTHSYVCFLCNMFRDEGWYLCVCVCFDKSAGLVSNYLSKAQDVTGSVTDSPFTVEKIHSHEHCRASSLSLFKCIRNKTALHCQYR